MEKEEYTATQVIRQFVSAPVTSPSVRITLLFGAAAAFGSLAVFPFGALAAFAVAVLAAERKK
jgi:hypothetical protein